MKKTDSSGRWCLKIEDINVGDLFILRNIKGLVTQNDERGLRIYWSNKNNIFYSSSVNKNIHELINYWLTDFKDSIYISSIHG